MDRARAGALAAAAAALSITGASDRANGAADEAVRVLGHMERDAQGIVLTASEVATELATAKMPQTRDAAFAALEQALGMAKHDVGKSNSLTHASAALAHCGEVDLAMETAEHASIGEDRVRALSMVAAALEAIGLESQAAASAERALSATEMDPGSNAESLSTIACILARCGSTSDALTIMSAVLSASDRWKSGDWAANIVRSATTVITADPTMPASAAKEIAVQALSAARHVRADRNRAEALGWAAAALDHAAEPVTAINAAVESVRALSEVRGGFGKVWSFLEVGSAMGRAPILARSDVLLREFQAMLGRDADVDVDLSAYDLGSYDSEIYGLALRGAIVVASSSDRVTFFFMITKALELGVPFGSGAVMSRIADELVTTDKWLRG